ncbi:TAXI family TRAP transporter solute-binding subunit [Neobacillus niacini]|uniref:TAXI family TRAP transporter solute-binding subunit n=1 Tax=Neobacillus niacini TaxID=86668 RepID=UPI003003826A
MKLRQKSLYLVVFLILTMMLVACSSKETGNASNTTSQDAESTVEGSGSSNGPTSLTIMGGTTPGGTGDLVATIGENAARIAFPNAAIRKTPGGTTEVVTKVEKGEVEIGYGLPPSNYEAFHGIGLYNGEKHENIRFVLALNDPSYITILALESSGINSLEDLKGKRIGIGDGRTLTSIAAKEILKAAGLTDDIMKKSGGGILTGDWGEQYRMLGDGQLDAVISGAQHPMTAITEMSATKKVKLVPFEEAVLKKVIEKAKWYITEMPANTYDWQKESYLTIAVASHLITNKEVPEDWIYEFTKAFWENQEKVVWPVKQSWNGIDYSKDALIGNDDIIPIHPGAEKYYKEVGLLP